MNEMNAACLTLDDLDDDNIPTGAALCGLCGGHRLMVAYQFSATTAEDCMQCDGRGWVIPCNNCGDDRCGKGSLIQGDKTFCNDDCFEEWHALVLSNRQDI